MRGGLTEEKLVHTPRDLLDNLKRLNNLFFD